MRRLLSPTNLIYVLVHFCLLLIGFLLLRFESGTLRGVGGSLVAAGIAGCVVLVYVLQVESLSTRINSILKFGFVSAFEGRSARIKSEYDSRLSTVSREIDVLGFGLRVLREDFAQDFKTWKAKASVRLLVIDPYYPASQSTYADQRDAEHQEKIGSIRTDVEDLLKEVKPYLTTTEPHPFEVRLFRCLPSIYIFRIDAELFWGPFLMHTQNRNSPTLVIGEGPLFNALMNHFDTIWKSNELSCSIDEYRKEHPESCLD